MVLKTAIFVPFLLASSIAGHPLKTTSAFEKRAIDQTTFDDLVFYLQYASSAYGRACAKPNGNTLVQQINERKTDTQGFIARDDTRKEIVVSMRGRQVSIDFRTDSDITLVPFQSPGVNAPAGAQAHRGFLTAWNAVAPQIIATVKSELDANPGFTIATTGHSLGGALSSLAGISMEQNFPNTTVRMFTYGQPRTGNVAYANFIDQQFGDRAARAVHTNDGVPTIIPASANGFQHHGVEFFQNPDPASAATTKKCIGGEDPTCSAAIRSGGINAAHLTAGDNVLQIDTTDYLDGGRIEFINTLRYN
ncbi:alpha/beta-hydrolase [Crassisporium funariophilum]|nr:alpha/beta-hydrolase [Crassisporium funariophilum]